jgi:hypothetical protein
VCTTELDSTFLNICVLVIYRSPTGKFNTFLTQLDTIMQTSYKPKLNLVMWGYVYVNYLKVNDKKKLLDALLNFYNLISTIDFLTRIHNDSSSAIDNIFVDITRINSYEVFPLISWLSGHEAQIIILHVLHNKPHEHQPYFRRNINECNMAELKNSLSYETRDLVFERDDVNTTFNSFVIRI